MRAVLVGLVVVLYAIFCFTSVAVAGGGGRLDGVYCLLVPVSDDYPRTAANYISLSTGKACKSVCKRWGPDPGWQGCILEPPIVGPWHFETTDVPRAERVYPTVVPGPVATPTPQPVVERERQPAMSAKQAVKQARARTRKAKPQPTATATPLPQPTPTPSLPCHFEGFVRDSRSGATFKVEIANCYYIPPGHPLVQDIGWTTLVGGTYTFWQNDID